MGTELLPEDMCPIEDLRKQLVESGIDLPTKHPVSGRPLVRGTVRADPCLRKIEFMPPRAPTRAIHIFDEHLDELVYLRDCTEEETRQAELSYQAAMAHYHETGGVEFVSDGLVVTGLFDTGEGKYEDNCEGRYFDGEWAWDKWSTWKVMSGGYRDEIQKQHT